MNSNEILVDEVATNACLQVSTSGQIYNPGTPGEGGAPEIATGFSSKKPVTARSYMVVAANPLATKAGCDILKLGGSAVDAAIAAAVASSASERSRDNLSKANLDRFPPPAWWCTSRGCAWSRLKSNVIG